MSNKRKRRQIANKNKDPLTQSSDSWVGSDLAHKADYALKLCTRFIQTNKEIMSEERKKNDIKEQRAKLNRARDCNHECLAHESAVACSRTCCSGTVQSENDSIDYHNVLHDVLLIGSDTKLKKHRETQSKLTRLLIPIYKQLQDGADNLKALEPSKKL